MEIKDLLLYVVPGKEWSLVGEPTNAQEYQDALSWFSEGAAPTWGELKAAEPAAEYQKNYDAISVQRRSAYQLESDPIFFQAQRGDTYTLQDWKDKIAEIDARYPYPAAPEGAK